MEVVGVLVADANDSELLRMYRAGAVVRPPFELCFDFYVDVRAEEVIYNVMDLLSLQANGLAFFVPRIRGIDHPPRRAWTKSRIRWQR